MVKSIWPSAIIPALRNAQYCVRFSFLTTSCCAACLLACKYTEKAHEHINEPLQEICDFTLVNSFTVRQAFSAWKSLIVDKLLVWKISHSFITKDKPIYLHFHLRFHPCFTHVSPIIQYIWLFLNAVVCTFPYGCSTMLEFVCALFFLICATLNVLFSFSLLFFPLGSLLFSLNIFLEGSQSKHLFHRFHSYRTTARCLKWYRSKSKKTKPNWSNGTHNTLNVLSISSQQIHDEKLWRKLTDATKYIRKNN